MNHSSLLVATDLKKYFPLKKLFQPTRQIKALDGVTISVAAGKTLAIVGESGCGKSTLGKVLLGIESPTEGSVTIDGRATSSMPPKEFRRAVQMIFQDPYSSLNPRKRAWEIISEPLKINFNLSKAERRKKAIDLMGLVGLRPEFADRYPHMFSGGQRQRLGIARALSLEPRVLICDEPISALDVSIQAQVINLLIELQDRLRLAYLFISHDLSVVRHIADDVAVMYLGRIVEYGSRQAIFEKPTHPYTQALLSATPSLQGTALSRRQVVQGEPPSPVAPPPGCAFHLRCAYAQTSCSEQTPELRAVQGRQVACHFAESISTQ